MELNVSSYDGWPGHGPDRHIQWSFRFLPRLHLASCLIHLHNMCVISACGQIVFGIVMVACLILTAIPTFNGQLFTWSCLKDLKDCDPFQKDEDRGYMKTVAIFMGLALLFELICIVWNFVAFCTCCCKKYIIHPLTFLSFITSALLLGSVTVYAKNNKGHLGDKFTHKDQFGYSFWSSVAALALAVVDTVVASVTVCMGRHCL
uniref:MARVEL domain-containing protein n=1 Tax=Angiostrongylus cantonensis TaxID=6313 RepID=A0A0K0DIZ7_ANGCA